MILDDEALVERVAKQMQLCAANHPEASLLLEELGGWGECSDFTLLSRAAIEAVRVHMWDDGK